MKDKNFSNLLLARLTRNIADSLFYMSAVWYISEKSALLTSLAMMCFTVPENILIFFGPFIDRYNRKKILLINSTVQIILVIILTGLLACNKLSVIPLFSIIFISTLLGNINYEVEDTVIPNIVSEENLVKANSLLEISYTITDSIFNGISGFLIASFSASVLYKLNIILFIIPIIFIKNLIIPIGKTEKNVGKYNFKEYGNDLIGGVKILFQGDIKKIVIPLVFINFCFVMTSVAVPFLSRQIENTAIIFGSLIVVKGIAGLAGAFFLNFFEKYINPKKTLSLGVFLQGITWLIMIFARSNTVILFLMYFVSFVFFGAGNILFTVFFQKIIPSNFLGRANTAIDAIITSAMPVGTLLAGFLLQQGVKLSIVMLPYGIASVLVGIYYFNIFNIGFNFNKYKTGGES
ncbi:MFS transporter [Treponema pedis]|uniref:MFS transporter n=2 Tax=Treponema pedis TaxID=409322 RepID=UPI003D1E0A6F